MKKRMILASIIIFSFLGALLVPNNTGEIQWTSFGKGIDKGKSSKKKMIVSVYTDWCSWCKKMDKSTFKNDNVSDYISKNYVAVKLNGESKSKVSFMGKEYTEQQLTHGFGITGFPATIFFDEKQEPITIVPGYIEADQFMNILKFIKDDIYKKKSFDEYLKSKS